MFVACSTLCFARHPLEQALRLIKDLEFTKVDVALRESGPHLRPSQVVSDLTGAVQQIRQGTGLTPVAFDVALGDVSEEEESTRFHAVCRLARLVTAPLLTLDAAAVGSGLDAETQRLGRLLKIAEKEGVLFTVATHIGTLCENPDTAVQLCQRVPGLGLTLDPSHYISGPHQGQAFDQVFPYIRHVRLRDTGRGANQFQVRVGQGEVEYGRIVTQLARHHYDRILSVDILDVPDAPFVMESEVRKLKYLLESLV